MLQNKSQLEQMRKRFFICFDREGLDGGLFDWGSMGNPFKVPADELTHQGARSWFVIVINKSSEVG